MGAAFARFARLAAGWAGSPPFFLLNLLSVAGFLAWLYVTPNPDRIILAYTAALTVLTQLVAVLGLCAQNADTMALQAKLDALVVATRDADNALVGAEERSAEELAEERDKLRAAAGGVH